MERVLRHNEIERKALEVAAEMMNRKAKELGYKPNYEVGNCYFDLGQDWEWTTIIYNKGKGGFQALYPAEWKKIIGLDFSGVGEVVERQTDILIRG